MIIDQQRAHIRILYDKYIDQISRRQGVSQGMLFPDIVQFPLSEVAILQEIMEDLSFLGFELTDLGGGSYAINGVPAGIEGLNPIDLIQNMVHTAMEKGGKVKEEVQSILALGAGASTKMVWASDRIERIENVKDIRNYIDRIDEMIERKRSGIHE